MDISRPSSPVHRSEQSPETADALLASELNNMTVADRTHVFEVCFIDSASLVASFPSFVF
jgi:hypothetical protein